MSDRLVNPSAPHAPSGQATAEPVPVNPATGRPAGRAEATVLLLASCMPVLGAVLIAPILPKIQDAFASTAGVEALTPIVLTVPALIIGLSGGLAGRYVDRVGRKGLLVGALILYAFLGTAPLWLRSLPLILASRVLVGLTEAAIMTCCTTLIVDYFHGPQRIKYLGLQTVYTTVAATLFFGIGGGLGNVGWRTPFWVYAVSLPLAAAVARTIWQPATGTSGPRARLAPVAWRQLAVPIAASVAGGAIFYVLVVELSFVLDGLGVKDSSTIGAISAAGSLAVALGAYLFPRLVSRGAAFTVPLALGITGLGLLVLGVAGSVPLVVVGALVTGFGNGLLLPAMLTWAVSALAFEQRGRGTGAWTAAVFLGQFACPLAVLALKAGLGGLGTAIIAVGVASLVLGAVLRALRISSGATGAAPTPA